MPSGEVWLLQQHMTEISTDIINSDNMMHYDGLNYPAVYQMV